MAVNTPTTSTRLSSSPPSPPHDSSSSSKTTLATLLSSTLSTLHTFLSAILPPTTLEHLTSLTHRRPILTSFLLLQLLFCALPLALFALFAAGVCIFSLAVALALATAFTLAVCLVCGVLVVAPVVVGLGGLAVCVWIGGWVGWTGLGVLELRGLLVEGGSGDREEPEEEKLQLGKWDGKWEESRLKAEIGGSAGERGNGERVGWEGEKV